MGKEKEPNFGFPPEKSRKEIIAGLEGAITATKQKIVEYEASNSNALEYKTHLKSLEQRLEAVGGKVKKAA